MIPEAVTVINNFDKEIFKLDGSYKALGAANHTRTSSKP